MNEKIQIKKCLFCKSENLKAMIKYEWGDNGRYSDGYLITCIDCGFVAHFDMKVDMDIVMEYNNETDCLMDTFRGRNR